MARLRGSLWGDMEGGRGVNGPGRAPDSGPLDHTASLLAGLLQDSRNKGAGLDLSAHLPGPGAPDAELGLPQPHVPGPWHRAPSRASRGQRHAAREMGTCPGLRLLAGPAEPSRALVCPPRSSPLGGGVPTLPWETRKQAQEGEPGALGGEADPVLEARAASPGCLVPTDLAHGVHWTGAWGQAGPREVTPTAGRSTGRMRMLCVGAGGRGWDRERPRGRPPAFASSRPWSRAPAARWPVAPARCPCSTADPGLGAVDTQSERREDGWAAALPGRLQGAPGHPGRCLDWDHPRRGPGRRRGLGHTRPPASLLRAASPSVSHRKRPFSPPGG